VQIDLMITGGAQPNFGPYHLKRVLFPLPPTLAEQEAIAGALSDADAWIESLEQLIAKKRQIKQGAMQELLTGKTRLPGFTGKWERKRLLELCRLKSGEGITAKDIDNDSSFPCFGGNGLRGFTSRFTHEGDYCLIGRVGALCGNVLRATGKFFASEHAIVATACEKVDVGWLLLTLDALKLNKRSEASAQPVLTVSKLLPLEVVTPSTESEQTAIAEVVSDMDAEIEALETKLSKARQIKQGMMQELLTGRIRLV
jgi:type I restriction enzyme S subunit